jgi:hypothetical protein
MNDLQRYSKRGRLMELTIPEIRIIIDALRFNLVHLQEEQAKLDDSQQDKIAELSNDMYALELLLERLKDDYTKRVKHVEKKYKEYFPNLPKTKPTVLVGEGPETYTDMNKK